MEICETTTPRVPIVYSTRASSLTILYANKLPTLTYPSLADFLSPNTRTLPLPQLLLRRGLCHFSY